MLSHKYIYIISELMKVFIDIDVLETIKRMFFKRSDYDKNFFILAIGEVDLSSTVYHVKDVYLKYIKYEKEEGESTVEVSIILYYTCKL